MMIKLTYSMNFPHRSSFLVGSCYMVDQLHTAAALEYYLYNSIHVHTMKHVTLLLSYRYRYIKPNKLSIAIITCAC